MAFVRRHSTLVAYGLIATTCFLGLRWLEPIRVSGRSMQPALHAGDLVFVARQATVGEGDVALLRPDGHGPVLHRVTEVLADGSVQTKGDANAAADVTATDRQAIAGKVVFVIPFGRLLERWR